VRKLNHIYEAVHPNVKGGSKWLSDKSTDRPRWTRDDLFAAIDPKGNCELWPDLRLKVKGLPRRCGSCSDSDNAASSDAWAIDARGNNNTNRRRQSLQQSSADPASRAGLDSGAFEEVSATGDSHCSLLDMEGANAAKNEVILPLSSPVRSWRRLAPRTPHVVTVLWLGRQATQRSMARPRFPQHSRPPPPTASHSSYAPHTHSVSPRASHADTWPQTLGRPAPPGPAPCVQTRGCTAPRPNT